MAITVQCFGCGSSFSAADQILGQQVQCPQCRTVFVATPAAPMQQPYPANQLWQTPAQNTLDRPSALSTPVVEGPSDSQMRLVAGICLPVMLIGMTVAFATWTGPNMPRLVLIGLGPFGVFFCIAALIDPNIARAAGKYGGHLPRRYKIIAGLIGVAALIVALIIALPLLLQQPS